ncbi:MAG: ribonuclease J [Candidatus Paceibacterota bacterium]
MNKKKADDTIPPLEKGVRVVPLGGVEEVGKNMTIIETVDDIFVVDVGFQFVSEYDAPGVDYVLPNTRYLEERKDKIRAVLITHGHLDHIGGIPFIMDRIGNPPLYTRFLTSIMIQRRQEEFPHLPKIDIRVLEPDDRVKIGNTYVSSFPVTHSIPDSMGFRIETELGDVLLTGDLKLDHTNGKPSKKEEDKFKALGKRDVLLFIADSTNAERPGFSITEASVLDNIESIVKGVSGRLIIGTFASQFERMIHIIKAAEKYGKKVATEGRSIKTNIEIAEKAGLLKIKKDTIIPSQDIGEYPPDKIVVIATGAQGEEFAALMRIATKKHRTITFNERDTVVLSSSIIPGNELAVQRLKDNLYRHNVKILHYRVSDVHSTGHGNAGELVWINQQINPTFFMPAYGYHSMLKSHAQAVVEGGFPKENVIVPDNGTVIDIIDKKKFIIQEAKAPSGLMMVDGFSVGDAQEVVIRDRQTLSQDGMFVIVATINIKTGKLRKSPDIISRGFIYLRESQGLLGESRIVVKKTIEGMTENMHPINFDYIKTELTDEMRRYLFQKTNKQPIVIPVLIGV